LQSQLQSGYISHLQSLEERIMSFRLFATALVAASFVATSLASAPALACTGKEIFADNFTGAGRGWQKFKGAAIGGGKAVLAADAGKSTALIYGGALFENADICVEVTIDQFRDPSGTAAGLYFWHDDWDNTGIFLISPDGQATIIRYQKGKKLTPVAWESTDLVDTKPNAVNKLRLTLKGKTQAAYINDKLFAELTMVPPVDGGKIGFDAESENDASNSWTFTKFRITEPPR
jgi:hypothetical protein